MSHRVTVQSEIKDREIAIQALKSSKIEYREAGDTIHMLSGDFNGANINLKTGTITSGDVDHYVGDVAKLGVLRQAYSEAKFRSEAFKQGISVESREVLQNGEIKLRCRTA